MTANTEYHSLSTTQAQTSKPERPKTSNLSGKAPTQALEATPPSKPLTGDDLLIEYTNRLVNVLKSLNETDVQPSEQAIIERFIAHSAWITQDTSEPLSLWQRLQGRLLEMRERHKRLAKSVARKEGLLPLFDSQYDNIIAHKCKILKTFTSTSLEMTLRDSAKGTAQELVEMLINTGGSKGILVILERRRFKYYSKLVKKSDTKVVPPTFIISKRTTMIQSPTQTAESTVNIESMKSKSAKKTVFETLGFADSYSKSSFVSKKNYKSPAHILTKFKRYRYRNNCVVIIHQ